MKYIPKAGFSKLLDILSKDYNVFVPVKKDRQRFYKIYKGSGEPAAEGMVVGEVRAFEPLKAFFSRSREKVSENFGANVPPPYDKPFAVIGAKACDLKGFKVQDFVFTDHDYADPIYNKTRAENLVISADCTCAIETCFCMALGIEPHPEEDFDINLSEVSGGFIIEAGSDKGRRIIEKNIPLFQDAADSQITERAKIRERVIKEVEDNLRRNDVPDQDDFKGIIERNYDSQIWLNQSKTCVECGACNTICPTCHCFLLADQKNEKLMARYRLWDSCMIKDFAKVAGGNNPRKKLWMRLRNRFEKKFDFFPKVAGVYACTGCGRCVSACPAKIDIRKVLKELVANA